jgi:hypothetical protein
MTGLTTKLYRVALQDFAKTKGAPVLVRIPEPETGCPAHHADTLMMVFVPQLDGTVACAFGKTADIIAMQGVLEQMNKDLKEAMAGMGNTA